MSDFRLQQTGDELQQILNTAAPVSSVEEENQRATLAEQGLQGEIDAEEIRAKAAEKKNADDIDVIESKIPAAASDQNKLADVDFVNQSIATATAHFQGSFNLVSDLHLTTDATESDIANALANAIIGADNNDYCFIQVPTADATPTQIARVDRYKFNGSAWVFEYSLNNSGFTAAQWAALNSGITSGLVSKLTSLPTLVELTTLFAGTQDVISDLSQIRTRSDEGHQALGKVNGIEPLIPSEASSSNKLVDTSTMNSSISTSTATYRGAFNLVSDLHLTVDATASQIAAELAVVIQTADNNDYCFVQVPTADATPTQIAHVDRYKFNGSAWVFEYSLNNSGFTAAQWAALNSGITSGLVTKLNDLPTMADLTLLLAGKQNVLTFDNVPTSGSNNPVKSGGIFSYIADVLLSYYTKTAMDTLLSGKQNTLTFDTAPTTNSDNPVTSGGVKTAIDGEASLRSQGDQTLQGNIDLEEARAKAAEKQNADDIDAEELARRNADTTLQGNIDAEEARAMAAEKANADDIDAIEAVIPSAAAANNKLVDTVTMNSSIATNTATFQGTYNLVTDLQLTVAATRSQIIAELATAISGADNNDYCFVQIPVADATPTEIARVERYKYNGSAWSYEYTINNSGFTAAQWAALNSGITLALVAKLSDLPSLAQLNTLLGAKQDVLTFDNQPTTNSNNPVKSGGIVDYIASTLASYYTKSAMDTLLAGKQATLTFDTTPTANSTNPVQSGGIKTALDGINAKIPAAATSANQLADKEYVAQQVQEYAGTFRGTFSSLADLEAVTGMHHNDYAWVAVTDSDGDNDYDRYKYNGTAWVFEYRMNNTHFTTTELASIRSGITAELVTKLTNLPPTAASTINATTGADTITNGKKFFVGTQGADGKWTLESLTPAEMQKCAYAYQAGATVGNTPAHIQGTDANGAPQRITPTDLASLLGVTGCVRGLEGLNGRDLETIGSGIWWYTYNCTNIPKSGTNGMIVCFTADDGHKVQIATCETDSFGILYVRTKWNAWTDWKKISLTNVA